MVSLSIVCLLERVADTEVEGGVAERGVEDDPPVAGGFARVVELDTPVEAQHQHAQVGA